MQSDTRGKGPRKSFLFSASNSGAWSLLCLGLIAALGNLLYIDWGLPNHYSWAPDAMHPYMVIDGLDQRFSNGWFVKSPPFHLMVTGAAYYPVLKRYEPEQIEVMRREYAAVARDLSTARAVVDVEHPATAEVTELMLVGRVLNALMTTLAALFICLAAAEFYGRRAGWFAGLITALHPLSIFYAHSMNTEAPMFLWCALGIFCYLRALKRQEFWAYAGLGLFAALAGASKDQSLALFALLPPLLLYSRAAHKARGKPSFGQVLKSLFDAKIVAGAAFFLLAFVLANNLFFNLEGYREHLAFNTPGRNMLERAYPLTISGFWGLALATLKNILDTATPGVFLLLLLGMGTAFYANRFKACAVLLPAVSYFVIFIGYIGFMEPRYVTPMVHVLAIFGGKFIADIMAQEKLARAFRVVLAGAAVTYILYTGFGTLRLFRDDPRYKAEAWIEKHVPAGSSVCCFATPIHTICRLPPGIKYSEAFPFIQITHAADRMRQSGAEYLVLNVFATNMRGKDASSWLEPLKFRLKRAMKLDLLAVIEAPRSSPAVSMLYVNPCVIIARRSADFDR